MIQVLDLPRRERERLSRRQAMLDAARAVFADKGYEQATLDEVAERAEFGKGTLYNYFEGGKEGILRALVEETFDGMEAVIAARLDASEGRPVADLFRDLLTDLVAHFEANRDTFVLITKEVQRILLTPEDDAARLVWERDERLVHLLVGPIERAVAAGELRALPAEAVARTVFGNMHGILMHLHCAPSAEGGAAPFSPAEAAAFITTVLFDGLHPREGGVGDSLVG
jgi:TetR/AcrR family transcriptional regulator, repressor of fatR-cypB operon